MRRSLVGALGIATVAAKEISSADFRVSIDDANGAVVGIYDPNASNTTMNWVSSTSNAPWQPLGSRWGLGFFDDGDHSLQRHFWKDPEISCDRETACTATYNTGNLQISVKRSVNEQLFTEKYVFRNLNNETLKLADQGAQSFAIFTPFNDHYTNSSDAISNRAHTHIWAHGGATAWVKMNQMGGLDRNLGLVLTKGSLVGYSVESRDTVTLSNTRGVFLLHPSLPALEPGEEVELEWKLFWHDDWEDFFEQCASLSEQFINFEIPNHTILPRENTTISMRGALVNNDTAVNGKPVTCDDSVCSITYSAKDLGEQKLSVTTQKDGKEYVSKLYLNAVQDINDLLAKRAKFITENQQIQETFQHSMLHGAYVLYDNQMNATVTFDTRSDRNAGRERIGMGIMLARYLRRNPDPEIEASLRKYYEFVCTKLQNATGYVNNGPGNPSKRLYNWPFVMQFHLQIAALGLNFTSPYPDARTPIDMFLLTLESFYAEGGAKLYALGLPILEGLRLLKTSSSNASYTRALSLFSAHADHILDTGLNYPSSEVNFEHAIVAPAVVMLLELYRATNNTKYLTGGELQLETLMRFAGKQPDFRLHDVAIRHWDGYWFGKDRMWGDTFPHYWSTLDALALHHYGRIVASSNKTVNGTVNQAEEFEKQADGIIRANLALFDEDGRGYCAWLYPTSVNGRAGHYADPYANDQDWALSHLLQIWDDRESDRIV